MIDPGTIELILFDVDGTISVTTPPIYEAVKRAFAGIGFQPEMSPTEMESWFGAPSADFYQALNPPHSPISWQDMRTRIHHEQVATYREFGKTYPEVIPTLRSLRKRGYKLALFSNSTPGYFYNVIEALDLADLFDYTECVGDHDLTKTELAGKIIRHFHDVPTAIVGDRSHDIQAARDNGALAIGAGYGFGKDEPNQADLVINEFKELAAVFDRRIPIFEKLHRDIQVKKQPDKPFIVGITGIDASGKTEFTRAFGRYLTIQGMNVQTIHIDDFHHPRKVRYAGENPVDNYLKRSFDTDRLVGEILTPLRVTGSCRTELKLLDLETDRYDIVRSYDISPKTIVLLEGVFLFREEIPSFLDLSIFLDITFEECLKRAASRDKPEVFDRYMTKYIPAQKIYLETSSPLSQADVVVNNNDFERPFLIR